VAENNMPKGASEKDEEQEVTELCELYEVEVTDLTSMVFSQHRASLKEVLNNSFFVSGALNRDTMRTLPTGLTSSWEAIRKKYKISRKGVVQSATTTHGLSRVLRRESMKTLIKAYKTSAKRAYVDGDTDTLSILEEKGHELKYVKPTEAIISVAYPNILEDLIGLVAAAVAMRVNQTNLYLAIESVINDPAISKFARQHLSQDSVKFWAHVDNRISALTRKGKGDQVSTGQEPS